MALHDRERNARFRELLRRPGLLRAPVCSDALSAMIIQKLGFEMTWIGGSASIASTLGKPDTGLATATDMIDRARQIAAAVDIPVVADADTGYGAINNVRHTVQGFEAAGVSGIHIEDQVMPKRLGELAGIGVIPAEEMVEKIKIACRSRRDPNFVIIGRTDAYGPEGVEGMIRRCHLYAAAGADVLYPHTVIAREDLERLTREVAEAPILHDVVEPRDTWSDRELEEMGFKIVIHGRANILCQALASRKLWTYYREHGETRGYLENLMGPGEWTELIDDARERNIRELLG